MTRSWVLLLVSAILTMGCGRIMDVSEDNESSLTLSVKSSDASVPFNTLQIWAFDCDAQGNVTQTANDGYISAAESEAIMDLHSKSRHCLLMAGVNLPAMFDECTDFKTLATAAYSERPDGMTCTSWTLVDLMDAQDGNVYVPVEVFPTCGRLCINVRKGTDAMVLRINDITLLSNNAPAQNTFFSAMTSEQIKSGGTTSKEWHFKGVSLPLESTAKTLVSHVDVSGSKQSMTIYDEYIHEHSAGWTDMTLFRDSGWTMNPGETEPYCDGYYLSISYTYSIHPDESLESNRSVKVEKFIPLPPICRGNEYRYNISFNLEGMTVFGSTETSDEIEGGW